MAVLISLIMVIISQCMLYPSIKFYALSIYHVFLVSYCSVNLKKKKTKSNKTNTTHFRETGIFGKLYLYVKNMPLFNINVKVFQIL